MEFRDNMSLNVLILLLCVKKKTFTIPELIEILENKLQLVYHGNLNIIPRTMANIVYQFKREGIIESGYSINKQRLYEEVKSNPTLMIFATILLDNTLMSDFFVDTKFIKPIEGLL